MIDPFQRTAALVMKEEWIGTRGLGQFLNLLERIRKKRRKKMVTERTLRRWRRDALKELKKGNELITIEYRECLERILRMTQELLDLHLIRK